MATVQQTSTSAPGGATDTRPEREFTVESRSQSQQIVRRFLHNKLAVGALIVYVLMVAAAFIVPLFYPWAFGERHPGFESMPPGTPGHLLGTQDIGRDLLADIMRGVQRSTFIALTFVLLAGVVGVLIGAVSGYFGRYVDN